MINLSKCKVLSVKAQKRLLECCPLEEGEELTSAFYNPSEKTFIIFSIWIYIIFIYNNHVFYLPFLRIVLEVFQNLDFSFPLV